MKNVLVLFFLYVCMANASQPAFRVNEFAFAKQFDLAASIDPIVLALEDGEVKYHLFTHNSSYKANMAMVMDPQDKLGEAGFFYEGGLFRKIPQFTDYLAQQGVTMQPALQYWFVIGFAGQNQFEQALTDLTQLISDRSDVILVPIVLEEGSLMDRLRFFFS